MQPSSSTRATIVSAENQNGATIVKATFFFCHYYIVWESNNAGEARGQSWNVSLKCRWILWGSSGYTSGTKRKHFAALSSPRPCWRWLQLQPSCGSPQCIVVTRVTKFDISCSESTNVDSTWFRLFSVPVMLSNNCHDSCSASIMMYNYTICTVVIPIWKHIFSSQNRYKESEQSMTKTYKHIINWKQTILVECS